ncbi:MAG TPA: tetratricopeptide repeat protein [Thermoanaerobaculia bacterium]
MPARQPRDEVDPAQPGSALPKSAAFALSAAFCLALIIATWANSLSNGFHFDDSHVVVNNLFLRDLSHAPRFFVDARTFSSLPANATYRPLTTLSLAIDYRLAGGLSSRFFHATQILLLVWLWAALIFFYRHIFEVSSTSAWNRYLALFSATIFAVHTANTETMNLISARSEILSALGLVAAFLAYFFFRRRKRTVWSLVAMSAGALAKIPAVLFGPLLFLWNFLTLPSEPDGHETRSRMSARVRRALVSAWPALVVGALVFVFVSKMDAPGSNYGGRSPIAYARTQLWVWLHYLRLFVAPAGLTADTDLELISNWYDTRVFAGLLAVAGLGYIAIRCAGPRETRPVTFGLGWFALTLLPTSSFIALAEPVNEHRVFLPYIGLTLAAVWGIWLLLQKWAGGRAPSRSTPRLVAFAAIAVVAALALGARARNEVWRSDVTLWADVTRKSPANGRGWMNYGLALMERGDSRGAKAAFERAAVLTPNYWSLEINLGIVNGLLGDPVSAEAHFRRALELGPNFPDAHFFYARWLVDQGRSPEALPHLEAAIGLSPAYETARLLRMDLLAVRGGFEAARDAAVQYLALDPSSGRAKCYASGTAPVRAEPASYETYFQVGLNLGQQQSFVDSALSYRAALRFDPRSADALNNLGWTLGKLGFPSEAIPFLERAVQIRPDFALARTNLGWARGAVKASSK